ncbi:putative plant bZIP transcription factor [Helianthus anomalus]
MVGLGVPGAVAATVGSPAVSSDGMGKNNGDTSSVSPSPYEFTGIVRGRRSGTVEKVVEHINNGLFCLLFSGFS